MITQKIDRRSFLKAGAGGLLLGFYLPEHARLKAQTIAASKLNAFVHVGSDDTVTLFIHMAEMGQGTVTSLSMLLAEELETGTRSAQSSLAWIALTVPCRAYLGAGASGLRGSLCVKPALPRAKC
jgi:CO/xanthine dehydrogenase Mo-binding subunit